MARKILIVDDTPPVVELLRCALSDAGYSTRSAATGEEALRKVRRSPPDLIVLDLLLPGMNGFSVFGELHSDNATASIPVVLITGAPGSFPRLTGLEMGADAFFSKPFDVAELVSCIGDLLEHRPLRQQELFSFGQSDDRTITPVFT